MRPLLALTLLAGIVWSVPDGAREGRRGNDALRAGDFEGAAAHYRDGLGRAEDPATRAALLDNLGAGRYAEARFEEAAAAFEAARAAAPTAEARARAAYHAGNAAARQQRFEDALARYREALLYRPDFPEARRNYELVARERTPPAGAPDDARPEPSAFALALKARADALVEARRYAEALALLEDGARTDSTVLAFSDFLDRLGAVVEIEQLEQP